MGNAAKKMVEEAPQPRRRLIDIVEDFVTKLIADEGEVTLDLQALEHEMEDKALGYQHVGRRIKQAIAGQERELEFLMEDVAKVKRRIARLEAEHTDMRKRLGEAMRVAGKEFFITVLGKIRFQKYPRVVLPEGWAKQNAEEHSKYVKVDTTYAPKLELMKADWKDMVATELSRMPADMPERKRIAEAERIAAEMMPEGFSIDPNEQLQGI